MCWPLPGKVYSADSEKSFNIIYWFKKKNMYSYWSAEKCRCYRLAGISLPLLVEAKEPLLLDDNFPRTLLLAVCSTGAIASFASNIPEIVELVGNQPKYSGSYKVRTFVGILTLVQFYLSNNWIWSCFSKNYIMLPVLFKQKNQY